jgi:hypothetical protein
MLSSAIFAELGKNLHCVGYSVRLRNGSFSSSIRV